MADHGPVEYAAAQGSDLPAHEAMYDRFVHLVFVGCTHLTNIVVGLAGLICYHPDGRRTRLRSGRSGRSGLRLVGRIRWWPRRVGGSGGTRKPASLPLCLRKKSATTQDCRYCDL